MGQIVVKHHWRYVMLIVAAIVLGACSSGAETATEDGDVTDALQESTTTTTSTTAAETTAVPETTTPATTTTEAVVGAVADLAAASGFSTFGSSALDPSGVTGIGGDELACISDGVAGLGASGNYDALDTSDQARVIEVAVDCAPEAFRGVFIDSFTGDAAAGGNLFDAVGAEAGDCFYDGLSLDDGEQPSRIAAFVYGSTGQPAPTAAVEPGANLIADCVDFNTLVDALGGAGLGLDAVIDQACVEQTFDRDASVDLYGTLLADPGAFDGGVVPDSLLGVFDCVDFGELLAEQFGTVVEVSDTEIACVNDVFRTPEIVSGFLNGVGGLPPEALGGLLECLDPETVGDVLGVN